MIIFIINWINCFIYKMSENSENYAQQTKVSLWSLKMSRQTNNPKTKYRKLELWRYFCQKEMTIKWTSKDADSFSVLWRLDFSSNEGVQGARYWILVQYITVITTHQATYRPQRFPILFDLKTWPTFPHMLTLNDLTHAATLNRLFK